MVAIPILTLGKRSFPAYCPLTRTQGDLSLSAHPAWPGIEACHACIWQAPAALLTCAPDPAEAPPPQASTPTSQTAEALEPAAPTHIDCTCPGAAQQASGLSAELDVFRTDGRKRRSFLDLMKFFGPAPYPMATPDGQVTPANVAAGAAQDLETPVRRQARAFVDAVRAELRFPNAAPVERIDLKFIEGTPNLLHRNPDVWQERWRYYWNGEHWVRKPPGASLHDWNKWGRRLEHMAAVSSGGLPPQDGWPPVLDLPPGRYRLRILDLHWKSGRRGEPELEWVYRVLTGPYQGRRIFYRTAVRTPAQRLRLKKDLMLLGILGPQAELKEAPFPLEPMLTQLARVAVLVRVCLQAGYVRLYLNRVLDRTRRAPADATRQPADATRQPADATRQPADATRQPADATRQPALSPKPALLPTHEPEEPKNGDKR